MIAPPPIFHTHSHIADARMETLVAHLVLPGAPLVLPSPLVSDCDVTEAAMEHIEAYGFGHIATICRAYLFASHADAAFAPKSRLSATPSVSLITIFSAVIVPSTRLLGEPY
ncbi:hypothetical protein KCP77_11565 [Salmonella enterica subsp. enterica]|nr:hypothetical protein KCP77_11565 [Salmonella enterica subsp. enterica]